MVRQCKKSATLANQAYRTIRDRILSGASPPGGALSRRSLAAQLGMSLVPVAEALQRLEAEGMIESRPRSGTRVRIPTPEEIHGYYLVREALESQAARLFAERATARQRKELARMARQVDDAYAASPLVKLDRQTRLFEIHRRHFLFHMHIAESAGCKELTQAIEKNQVLIFQWLYNSAAHFDTLPPRWHQELVEALSSGDPDRADKAMRHHVRFRRGQVAERIGAYAASAHARGNTFRGPRSKTTSAP